MKKLTILKNIFRNNKLINDSFWSLTGNVIGRGLSLFAGILVARFLGKDIYGEFGIIKDTILSVAMFSTFGLGYTATKFVADLKNNNKEKLNQFVKYATSVTLIISSTLAFILFLFAPKIADSYLNAPHLINALRILSVLVIFNSLTTTQIGVIAGLGRFKDLAKINSIIGGVNFLLSVGFTYYWDLNGALFALLITQMLNWFLNYRLVKLYIPRKKESLKRDDKFLKEILYFSSPVALQEGAFSLSSWLLSYSLIYFGGYGELGMFTVTAQWNSIVLFIPGILRNVVLSHLSGNIKDERRHSKIMKQTLIINFTTTLIMSLVIIIFSKMIASFYGSTFEGVDSLISIAVFTTIFSSMGGVYAQAYMSKGRNWEMLIIRLIRDFGLVIAFVVFQSKIDLGKAKLMIVLGLIFNVCFLLIMAFYYKRINYKSLKQVTFK